MSRHYKDVFSAEVIDFQRNDPFVDKLTSVITDIFAVIKREDKPSHKKLVSEYDFFPKMEKLIKDRFGLNVSFPDFLSIYFGNAVAWVWSGALEEDLHSKTKAGLGQLAGVAGVPGFSTGQRASIDFQRVMKDRSRKMLELHGKKGEIDRKNARVSGYFSEIQIPLGCNFINLYAMGFSPREVTSVLLHEIGHAFSSMELRLFQDQLSMTLNNFMLETDETKRSAIVTKFNAYASASGRPTLPTEQGTTIVDLSTVAFSSFLGGVNELTLSADYGKTTSESLADSFATRFGMGKELTSGLMILREYAEASIERKIQRQKEEGITWGGLAILVILGFFVKIIWFILFAVLVIKIVTTGAGALKALFRLLSNTLGVLLGHKYSFQKGSYDTDKDRVQRILNTMIRQLKVDSTLETKYLQKLVDDVRVVIDILDTIPEDAESTSFITRTFSSSYAEGKHFYKVERVLEDMYANRLFYQAARIA